MCRRRQQLTERDTGGEIVHAPLRFAATVRIISTFGIGLPGHTGISAQGAVVLSGLSTPADFVESLVAHAEVVADFVKDGLADLFAKSFGGEAHS